MRGPSRPPLLGASLSLQEAGRRESFSLSLGNAFLEGMTFPTASQLCASCLTRKPVLRFLAPSHASRGPGREEVPCRGGPVPRVWGSVRGRSHSLSGDRLFPGVGPLPLAQSWPGSSFRMQFGSCPWGDLKLRNLLCAAATEWNSNPGSAQIACFAFKSQTKPAKQLGKRSESSECMYLSASGPGDAPVVCSVPPKGAGVCTATEGGKGPPSRMGLVCRKGARVKQG